jgi:hypothetical protein
MTVHHLVPNPTNRANRFAKTRRNWLEPISDPKNNPHFEPAPDHKQRELDTAPACHRSGNCGARRKRKKSCVPRYRRFRRHGDTERGCRWQRRCPLAPQQGLTFV